MTSQSDDHDLVRALVPIVRAADEQHETEGGGTRHWLRDYFLPRLNEAGFVVVKRDA